ncbi:hypothetical protein BDV11DRAFT_197957 [Aspergillus similis]
MAGCWLPALATVLSGSGIPSPALSGISCVLMELLPTLNFQSSCPILSVTPDLLISRTVSKTSHQIPLKQRLMSLYRQIGGLLFRVKDSYGSLPNTGLSVQPSKTVQ